MRARKTASASLETLAQPEYVGVPIEALRMSLSGTFDYGNGRIEKQPSFYLFAGEGVNEPSADKADWVVRNLLRSGLVPDRLTVPRDREAEWFRADLYQEAVQFRGKNA